MEIPFVLRGVDGRVVVSYERNVHPETVGCPPDTRDFPICTATVEYPFRGYDSLLGWIQLVRSTDNLSGGARFETDPLSFLGDLTHPFCWLGLNPTLFDAPARSPRIDMAWTAHSFLCVPDDVGNGLEARPMLGFSWGFRAADGEIALDPPTMLTPAAWDEHIDTLGEKHPAWHFSRGFADVG